MNEKQIDEYFDEKGRGLEEAKERARRVASKSIGAKAKRIWGSFYAGDYITREQIAGYLKIAGLVVAGLIAAKGIATNDMLDTYETIVKKQAIEEMPIGNAKEFVEGYDESKLSNLRAINAAIEELDDDDYKINGDRKDGTHSDLLPFDGGSLFSPSDKQLDAMTQVANDQIEEYRRSK